jgi:hypothetical protein
LLTEPNQKILENFIRAYLLLICQVIDYNILNKVHKYLFKVATLISKKNYSSKRITLNLHVLVLLYYWLLLRL